MCLRCREIDRARSASLIIRSYLSYRPCSMVSRTSQRLSPGIRVCVWWSSARHPAPSRCILLLFLLLAFVCLAFFSSGIYNLVPRQPPERSMTYRIDLLIRKASFTRKRELRVLWINYSIISVCNTRYEPQFIVSYFQKCFLLIQNVNIHRWIYKSTRNF